jgi:hypothetical protein
VQALLEENLKQKELRERRLREKEAKELARREALSVKKEQLMKTKGCAAAPAPAVHARMACMHSADEPRACRYARLLAQEYDRKLKEARQKGKRRFNVHETVDGQMIDVHASQSSLLGREASTPSVSTSGFNFNEFVAQQGSAGADSGAARRSTPVATAAHL